MFFGGAVVSQTWRHPFILATKLTHVGLSFFCRKSGKNLKVGDKVALQILPCAHCREFATNLKVRDKVEPQILQLWNVFTVSA